MAVGASDSWCVGSYITAASAGKRCLRYQGKGASYVLVYECVLRELKLWFTKGKEANTQPLSRRRGGSAGGELVFPSPFLVCYIYSSIY